MNYEESAAFSMNYEESAAYINFITLGVTFIHCSRLSVCLLKIHSVLTY